MDDDRPEMAPDLDIGAQISEAVRAISEQVRWLETLDIGYSDHVAMFEMAAQVRKAGHQILSATEEVAGSIDRLALFIADLKLNA